MHMTTTTLFTRRHSPVGSLLLSSNGSALTGLSLHADRDLPRVRAVAHPEAGWFAEVAEQLDAYFAGTLTRFDLPLAPRGTGFQRAVWSEMGRIPYGTTISYGELARRVGRPGAARAVGLASGRNPIAIIVPCHRVIGADGRLTGYGGGLERKQQLLELEARHATQAAARPQQLPLQGG